MNKIKIIIYLFFLFWMIIPLKAQGLSSSEIKFLTNKWQGERFDDGRPKVSNGVLERMKRVSIEEAWGVLRNEGRATSAQISMCKRNNVDMALNIAREARQILGAMGITGEYSIMRHMMNLESVITYEGTHDIHLLITGMDITGENAFK